MFLELPPTPPVPITLLLNQAVAAAGCRQNPQRIRTHHYVFVATQLAVHAKHLLGRHLSQHIVQHLTTYEQRELGGVLVWEEVFLTLSCGGDR